MEGCKALFVGFLLFSWGGLSIIVSGDSSKSCEFPAIYNFGDSNSATGNSSTILKSSLSPYADGRACDGRVIIDFIAEHIKSPYLIEYSNSSERNFRHGANFAVGGSAIRWYNKNSEPRDSLDMQIQRFKQFKSRSKQLYNEAKDASEKDRLPRQEDFAKALYMFDIGQNDLTSTRFDQLQSEIPDIVSRLASSVQDIYQQGGRVFWIHNTGPYGCLPLYINEHKKSKAGDVDEHGCVKPYNNMATEFNKQLKERVTKLRSELSEAAITYVDIYAAKYELISNAKNLGFDDPLAICCGKYQENKSWAWCGSKETEVCKEPSKFVNWDSVHCTEAANKWVTNRILNGSLTDPSIPITQTCHKQ